MEILICFLLIIEIREKFFITRLGYVSNENIKIAKFSKNSNKKKRTI